jgi:hypothetical protein
MRNRRVKEGKTFVGSCKQRTVSVPINDKQKSSNSGGSL